MPKMATSRTIAAVTFTRGSRRCKTPPPRTYPREPPPPLRRAPLAGTSLADPSLTGSLPFSLGFPGSPAPGPRGLPPPRGPQKEDKAPRAPALATCGEGGEREALRVPNAQGALLV